MPKNLAHFTRKFPPFFVAVLARKPVDGKLKRGMSIDEISEASGIPRRSVARLTQKLTWAHEKHEVIDKFCDACNFSFFNTKINRDFLIRTMGSKYGAQFSHLTKREKVMFSQRCAEWAKMNVNAN